MGEPMTRRWRAIPAGEPWRQAQCRHGDQGRRGPVLVALDGRSGSGKTTLAARLAAGLPGALVVHTDDVAWHHSFFDWHDELRRHVLEPLRRGEDVDWQPPGWAPHGRTGSLVVPAGCPGVVVEGVSASHARLRDCYDLVVWLQCDPDEARRRCLARDGADQLDFIEQWDAAEHAVLAADQPWRHADLVLDGEPHVARAGDGAELWLAVTEPPPAPRAPRR